MRAGRSGSESSSFHSFDGSDELSSGEEEEERAGAPARRSSSWAERDFDTVEDDPGGTEGLADVRLREWMEARGEEVLLHATISQLRASGVDEDEWITALEGMEHDGVLAGFLAQIESTEQAQDEESALPQQRNGQFRMSTLMRTSDSDGEPEPEPEPDPGRGAITWASPAQSRQVINPLRLATHGSVEAPAKQSPMARQSAKWRRRRGAAGTGGSKAGYHNDTERSQNAIKRIAGILESDLSSSLVRPDRHIPLPRSVHHTKLRMPR